MAGEKMRKLYLWNDLDLFGYEKEKINAVWEQIVFYIRQNNNCQEKECYFYNTDTVKYWIENYHIEKCNLLICLGTRPSICAKTRDLNYLHISPKRIRRKDGSTERIYLNNTEYSDLKKYLLKNIKEVYILEDAIVNGETMRFLLTEIRKINFNGNIFVNCLFGNKKMVENLQEEFAKRVVFNIENCMDGYPIQDSTLICMQDLLYGYISDGVHYYERMDLIERFIENPEYKLLRLIEKLIKQLGE